MMKRITYFFLCILPGILLAQSKVDSLTRVLAITKPDTEKIKILVLLAGQYGSNDPARALSYANKAAVICDSPDYDTTNPAFKKIAASAYRNQGASSFFLGDYATALAKLNRALRIYQQIKYTEGAASIYGWIGNTYYSRGEFEKALEALIKALDLHEKQGNPGGMAGALNGIANIYQGQKNTKKALEYYFKSLKIRLSTADSISIAYTYNNIGLVYMTDADSLDKALEYHLKCLDMVERFDDKKGMENSYGNIGEIYTWKKRYDKALIYQLKSLKIAEEISDKTGIAACYNSIGKIHLKLNDPKKALASFEKGLLPASQAGSKEAMKESYNGLAETYQAMNDYKKAVQNFELYAALKDSLMSENNGRNMEEMQARFETEKKEQEIQLLKKDEHILELKLSEQEANIHRQRIVIYSAVGGFIVILLLVFFIWKSYREKKMINLGLERKNIEINVQKNQIEEKNILITDSIEYARSIQNAILPSAEMIQKSIPDSFILFMPKDIVSGDFYWLKAQGDHLFLASVDCTGHGVPGAFMSVMAHNMLENIVEEKKLIRPSLILDELNKTVLETLKQETGSSSVKYGMDISLIALNKKNNKLLFSGAHNPLLLVRSDKNSSLTQAGGPAVAANSPYGTKTSLQSELKADKTTIGMAREKFTDHELEINAGDMLYLFTDGFPDQKGGPESKKFFASRFKELLFSIASKNTTEQKEILRQTFSSWKDDHEQIDDVLVIGVRV